MVPETLLLPCVGIICAGMLQSEILGAPDLAAHLYQLLAAFTHEIGQFTQALSLLVVQHWQLLSCNVKSWHLIHVCCASMPVTKCPLMLAYHLAIWRAPNIAAARATTARSELWSGAARCARFAQIGSKPGACAAALTPCQGSPRCCLGSGAAPHCPAPLILRIQGSSSKAHTQPTQGGHLARQCRDTHPDLLALCRLLMSTSFALISYHGSHSCTCLSAWGGSTKWITPPLNLYTRRKALPSDLMFPGNILHDPTQSIYCSVLQDYRCKRAPMRRDWRLYGTCASRYEGPSP